MKKEEQNPVFEVWLAAFQSRLIEVCAPSGQAPVKEDEKAAPQQDSSRPKNS
jgi:hypothetical protein